MTTASFTTRRREPKQHRSRLLVSAIREACLRILKSGRGEPLTAKHIAEVAGVTIGSFYQYYPNKEAVLVDVLLTQAPDEADRLAAETRYIHNLRETSLTATLEALVEVTCTRHRRMLALHTDIYRQFHRQMDFLLLMRESVRKYVEVLSWEQWVLELLERHQQHITLRPLDTAAFMVATTITCLTAEAVDNAPHLLDDPVFQQHLLQMLLSYLGVRDA